MVFSSFVRSFFWVLWHNFICKVHPPVFEDGNWKSLTHRVSWESDPAKWKNIVIASAMFEYRKVYHNIAMWEYIPGWYSHHRSPHVLLGLARPLHLVTWFWAKIDDVGRMKTWWSQEVPGRHRSDARRLKQRKIGCGRKLGKQFYPVVRVCIFPKWGANWSYLGFPNHIMWLKQ